MVSILHVNRNIVFVPLNLLICSVYIHFSSPDVLDRLQLTFTLHVNVESGDADTASSSSSNPNSTRNPLKLRMPGSKTVGEVMSDVYDLTNIPVRHQQWTGE